MSQRDDPAVQALQKIIDDVATRSYRIREWWHLETHLRKVEASFKRFSTTLQHVGNLNDWSGQASTLTDLWQDCQLMDLPELNSFAQNFEHVHKPVVANTTNYPDPQAGTAALVGIGNSIQQALNPNTGSLDALKRRSIAFQTALAGQLANRRAMMHHEVEQLCQVTFQLRQELNKPGK
jgi:hypothetical protein